MAGRKRYESMVAYAKSKHGRETVSKRFRKHGMRNTRFYGVYRAIRNRCENKKSNSYKYYGARGIKCEWLIFEDFMLDMYDSYRAHISSRIEKDTTIERIDVNGNYNKENCRWATVHEQNLSKRDDSWKSTWGLDKKTYKG